MKIHTIYIKPNSLFSNVISDWAAEKGVQVEEYDFKSEEFYADGLLLINANQDIDKEVYELHNAFDAKHLPTQKIDINGTLQVAVSNFQIWLKNYKCANILILGSDDLVKNENLDRFLSRI